jgi:hypothetical protein
MREFVLIEGSLFLIFRMREAEKSMSGFSNPNISPPFNVLTAIL